MIINRKTQTYLPLFLALVLLEMSVSPQSLAQEIASNTDNSNSNITQNENPTSAEAVRVSHFKQTARRVLLNKLSQPDGAPAKIYVLTPINYTELKLVDPLASQIQNTIQSYDKNIDIRRSNQSMPALTLESFRLTVAKLNADIVIISVLNSTAFEMYLYDKRTPRQIYAHSEPLASSARYELTQEAASYYTKLLIRRTLYRYIKNQYYEMPRDDTPPILQTEIPRYIASTESLEMINREVRSNFYISIGMGAAISKGITDKFWNSNLNSGQLGVRLYDKWYLEASFNMFAYNAPVAAVKYLFSNRDSSFRFMGGLGVSYFLKDRQVLNWDQTNGQLQHRYYVVPSFTLLLPISEIYLKAETQLYMPTRALDRFVFTIMPGLMVMF